MPQKRLTCLELCAGGGQALGLEAAGFEPVALVDNGEGASFQADTHNIQFKFIQVSDNVLHFKG